MKHTNCTLRNIQLELVSEYTLRKFMSANEILQWQVGLIATVKLHFFWLCMVQWPWQVEIGRGSSPGTPSCICSFVIIFSKQWRFSIWYRDRMYRMHISYVRQVAQIVNLKYYNFKVNRERIQNVDSWKMAVKFTNRGCSPHKKINRVLLLPIISYVQQADYCINWVIPSQIINAVHALRVHFPT